MSEEQQPSKDTGPIYGVPLIRSLSISGGMIQAMPSRQVLNEVRSINEKVVAGYEVAIVALESLTADLAAMTADRDRLREVVEKLPVTGDGVVMIPGMEIWTVFETLPGSPIAKTTVGRLAMSDDGKVAAFDGYSDCMSDTELVSHAWYSTREAALAAREQQAGVKGGE